MLTRRTGIPVAAALLALGVCWACFRHNEPKYHGRTLAQWFAASRLQDQAARPPEDEYRDALRALGTNDLPGLTRWIAFDVSHSTPQKLIYFLPDNLTPQPVLKYLFNWKRKLSTRADDAVDVFHALGPQAAPAIPELTRIATQRAMGPRMRAMDCLGFIGADAIPSLIMVATDRQPGSSSALGWLLAFTNSPQAMQIVAQYGLDPRSAFQATPPQPPATTNTQVAQ